MFILKKLSSINCAFLVLVTVGARGIGPLKTVSAPHPHRVKSRSSDWLTAAWAQAAEPVGAVVGQPEVSSLTTLCPPQSWHLRQHVHTRFLLVDYIQMGRTCSQVDVDALSDT